jgi:Gram-negative bacterial TonB protein C-terminal
MTSNAKHSIFPLAPLALVGAVALALAGCAAQPSGLVAPTTTTFTNSAADPQVVQQIMADSGFLQKNRLPKRPAAGNEPKNDATCPVDKIKDRGAKKMVLPADLMTTLVMHDAKPWAYVRYDVDTDGTPLNIKIEASSGLKSFDRAAIETVTGWRFDLGSGLTSAHGCVSEVSIT